jgi:hypothetical protein
MSAGSRSSRRSADRWLLTAAALSLVLSLAPWGWIPLYPFRLATTWIHECGHAIATVLLGGSVRSITIASDGSGLTHSLIPGSRIVQGLVSSAGYLGSSVVGCLLLAATRRAEWERRIIWGVGAFMLLTAVVWIRNLFGFAAVLAWGGGLVALGRKGSEDASRFVLSLLAIQVALNAVFDIRVLFLGVAGPSDADAMARLFLLPSWVWAGVWMILSLGMLGWTVSTTRSRT